MSRYDQNESPTRTRSEAWLRRAVSVVRPRTILSVAAVELAWVLAGFAGHGVESPPFTILGRTNGVLAGILLVIAWANGRRLHREATRRATRSPPTSTTEWSRARDSHWN
jgi:hypothetical protein